MQGTWGKFTANNTYAEPYMTRQSDKQLESKIGDNQVLNQFM